MITVCLGNKVSCGNRDDIFNKSSHQNKPEFIIIGLLLYN